MALWKWFFFIKPFENVNSVFLAHLLRSAVYRNKLESLSTGATMQNLSNQSLSDLVIAMPSLDEQNRITNKIDDLTTKTQHLESIYRQNSPPSTNSNNPSCKSIHW
jgi:type I restriction enzyme S subunit